MKKTTEEFLSGKTVCTLLALVCCFLWGSAFPCIKIGYKLCSSGENAASQILFAGSRFIIAGIMVIIFTSISEKRFVCPKSYRSFGRVCILSMFQTILQYLFFYIGLSNTTGVKASIIEGAGVFAAIGVGAFIFRLERITAAKIIGCIIGFSGIVLINLNGLDYSLSLKGEGFILISTLAYAFSTVLIKKFGKDEDTLMLSGWQFFVGGIIMTSIGLIAGGSEKINSAGAVLILLYLAFISAAAYSLWSVLLKYNPVSRVAVMGFSNTMFGVLLSAIILGETDSAFSVKGIISLILVCLGIWIVNFDWGKLHKKA